MNAIVNVNRKWGIGKDGKLLCNIRKDMEFFREKTMNKVIIYGNNTLKSFHNKAPLKGRLNIVITRNKDNIDEESKNQSYLCWKLKFNDNGIKKSKILFQSNRFSDLTKITNKYGQNFYYKPILLVATSIEEAVSFSRELAYDEDIFICGGDSIYKQMMPYIDTVYVTKNDCTLEADSFFPNLDEEISDNGTYEWVKTESITTMDSYTDKDIICEFCIYKRRELFIKNIKGYNYE